MNRWLARTLAALALGICLAQSASAQPQIGSYTRPKMNSRPTISPYLNINRGGNAAINYYGIVRPQLDTQRQINVLQQEFQGLQEQTTAPGTERFDIPITGRGFGGFFNYSHYYPSLNQTNAPGPLQR